MGKALFSFTLRSENDRNSRRFLGSFGQRFQEAATAAQVKELGIYLSIAYTCIQRIANWNDDTNLVRLFPEEFVTRFPPITFGDDWQATAAEHPADRILQTEFHYHAAPDAETWREVTAREFGFPRNWAIKSFPWYNEDTTDN